MSFYALLAALSFVLASARSGPSGSAPARSPEQASVQRRRATEAKSVSGLSVKYALPPLAARPVHLSARQQVKPTDHASQLCFIYGFQHTPSLSVNQYTRTPTLATITCRQLYHTTRRAQGRVSTYTRYCVNYMQHSGVVCCVLITPHSVSSQAGAPPPRRLLFKSLIYCERVRLAIVRRANAILLEHQANALLND